MPWRGGCEYRERALGWVLEQYAEHHPGWNLVLSKAPPGPWAKAKATMPAVEASSADVVVVTDADVWCEGISQAVGSLSTARRWAVPHRRVMRLSERATAALLAGGPVAEDLAQPYYEGKVGGGIVVAHRQTLLNVPLDSRFRGWGQEDTSWGLALKRLAGPGWRGEERLVHLWHPPQERMTRAYGSEAGRALWRRYAIADREGDLRQLRKLIEEAKT